MALDQILSELPVLHLLHFFLILTSPLNEKKCISRSVSLTWQHRHSHSFTGKGLVHNELRFGGKVECTKGIKIVFVLGRNIGDHDGVRRAAQRVLQQPCQFTVSVRHTDGSAGVKRVHHFAESEQREVDGAALLQTDALVAGAAVVLRPSQVYQVQLACLLPVRQGALSPYNLDR